MRIIAHRANINGPDLKTENSISNIRFCIASGFDVEIDIRLLDNNLYLGHDKPVELISNETLLEIKDKSWIHCKNMEALSFFYKNKEEFNYFWHEKDSYSLTSKGFIWTFPGQALSTGCVCVMPELQDKEDMFYLKKDLIFGVCTDYPNLLM
mgnify:CR=1 FL=1|tara:strand:+ start:18 stop:473 length:456 start_codon:yes stop_codon:yes gene_type:complete